MSAPLPESFVQKFTVTPEGCWAWTAARTHGGYGRYAVGYRMVLAHRFAYETMVGPIPEGLHLDHLCRNRACCNPAHLEPVTPRENWRRGETPSRLQAEQTHCKRGHPLTPGNYYVKTLRHGGQARQCKQCTKAATDERRAKHRAQGLNNQGRAYRYAAWATK